MPMYLRGGVPRHLKKSLSSGPIEAWTWSGGIANYVWLKNAGAASITVSFNAEDAAAGLGLTLAAGDTWEGPTEISHIYTSVAAAGSLEAIVFLRRG